MSASTAGGARPGAVLLDLDGTLVHSAPDIAAALNDLLAEEGLAAFSLAAVAAMIGGGVRLLVRRGFEARGRPLGDTEADALADRFMRLYVPRATRLTRLMPGAEAAVAALSAAGIGLAVCTNKPEAVSRTILAALGLADRFALVVGGDSGLPKKPRPDMLLHAARFLGAAPEETLMVGDSVADVAASRAAGIRCAVVEGGYTTVPAAELGADLVLASLAELPAVLALSRAA